MNTSLLDPSSFRADTVIIREPAPAPVQLTPEFVVTDKPWHGEPVSAPFRRLSAELNAREAQLLSLMVYGGIAARAEIERGMREALGATHWPVTWVDGSSSPADPFAGFQALAVSGRNVTR